MEDEIDTESETSSSIDPFLKFRQHENTTNLPVLSQFSFVSLNVRKERSLDKQWPLFPKNTRALLNSTSLDKIYKSALKEMGKLKSPIAPNLKLKRRHSQSPTILNAIDKDHSDSTYAETWIEPKHTVKNLHRINKHSSQLPQTLNRFEALAPPQFTERGYSQQFAQ